MKKIFFLIFAFLTFNARASLLHPIDEGLDFYRNSQYKKAHIAFIAYIDSNPNDPDGYFWLGKIYNALGNKKLANNNYQKAYEIVSKEKNISKINLDSKDGNIEDYFDMALGYFEEKNYKEADFYADLMLRADPNSKSAYFVKAKIAQTLKDYQNAVEYLNKAILLDPELLNTNLAKSLGIVKMPVATKEFYNSKALHAWFSGDIEGAIKYYNSYLKLNPSDCDAYNFLADLYIKKDDFQMAQNTLNKAVRLNSNNILNYINQAKIYKAQKDKRLEKTLLKGYKINPNNKEILLALGNFYLDKKDYQNSKKYFEILTNLDDNYYEAYFGYIFSLIELKNTDKASSLIRKLVSFKQKNGEDLFLLAKICIALKQYTEAQDYLYQAIAKENNRYYQLELDKIKDIK